MMVRPLSAIVAGSALEQPLILPSASNRIERNHSRLYSSTIYAQGDDSKPLSSPFGNKKKTSARKTTRRKTFVPRKAAVALTETARNLFRKLLENNPEKDGILLNYNQSSSGQPRMVFSFSFVTKDELHENDEGVSLEVDETGAPKNPSEALDDGIPKLYVHHNAFIKVLGATVDVDTATMTPKLFDKEGFELDANV